MMGAGKTTIAKAISELLTNYTLVDTDELIVQKEKCSINEIFSTKGEAKFREIETSVLQSVLNNDNQIISTGGGIILSDFNTKLLKDKSIIFYLYADEDTLYNRVKSNKDRPLLNNTDIRDKIHKLMAQRHSKYEQAHFSIDTREKQPKDIAVEIIRKSGINGNN